MDVRRSKPSAAGGGANWSPYQWQLKTTGKRKQATVFFKKKTIQRNCICGVMLIFSAGRGVNEPLLCSRSHIYCSPPAETSPASMPMLMIKPWRAAALIWCSAITGKLRVVIVTISLLHCIRPHKAVGSQRSSAESCERTKVVTWHYNKIKKEVHSSKVKPGDRQKAALEGPIHFSQHPNVLVFLWRNWVWRWNQPSSASPVKCRKNNCCH